MEIFFSVGEPSGDQHAAHLIRELQQRNPKIRCTGFGGPLMQQAGCRLEFQLTDLAVMGLLNVLRLISKFYRLIQQGGRYLEEHRPDAVVLIDFPGFNWWIARRAKKLGIPVYYYLPPQIWAWASWRVKRMQRFVDHVICGLPFEKDWYAKHGVAAEYVGHPFFDEVADYPLDVEFRQNLTNGRPQLVGILPGSRGQEVTRNWAVIFEVIKNLHQRHPDVRFLVACYKETQRDWCVQQYEQSRSTLPIEFYVGKTSDIIDIADCCLMVSGSVSLEMLARTKPAVVVYRGSWLLYVVLKTIGNVRFATLPNLMVDREIMPEFPFVGDPAPRIEAMTSILNGWLNDREQLDAVAHELRALHEKVGQPGATKRTAEFILRSLKQGTASQDENLAAA